MGCLMAQRARRARRCYSHRSLSVVLLLFVALPLLLCLSGLTSAPRAPVPWAVAAEYVDESQMDMEELVAEYEGSKRSAGSLAEHIKKNYGGSIDGYQREKTYRDIPRIYDIGGGRLESFGLATHVSEVPAAAAFNYFFDGFHNKTHSLDMWRPSMVNGYDGTSSICVERLGNGAERFDDRGLYFREANKKHAKYAIMQNVINANVFNFRNDVTPLAYLPQVFQYEVAFTEGLTCSDAQLKVFTNIVTNSSKWYRFDQNLQLKKIRPKTDWGRTKQPDEVRKPLWEYHTVDMMNNSLANDIVENDPELDAILDEITDPDEEGYQWTWEQYRLERQVSNNTEASVVFGPGRCGDEENVVVEVKSYQTTVTKLQTIVLTSVTHRLTKKIKLPPYDNLTHVYTLELNPWTAMYYVYVDMKLEATGMLNEDFEPPFNPQKYVKVPRQDKMLADAFGGKMDLSSYNTTDGAGSEEDVEFVLVENPAHRKDEMMSGGLFTPTAQPGDTYIAIGFEFEPGDPGIFVDNVLFSLGANATNALEFAKRSWRVKFEAQFAHTFPDANMHWWWNEPPMLPCVMLAVSQLILPASIRGPLVERVRFALQQLITGALEGDRATKRMAVARFSLFVAVYVVGLALIVFALLTLKAILFSVCTWLSELPSRFFGGGGGGAWGKSAAAAAATITMKKGGAKTDENGKGSGSGSGSDDDASDDVVVVGGGGVNVAPPPRRRLRTRRD